MPRGVRQGPPMVMYNARIEQEQKALLDNLVKVSAHKSQRELLEEMTQLYEQAYPDRVAKARERMTEE